MEGATTQVGQGKRLVAGIITPTSVMLSMNTSANKLMASSGNMNSKPSEASGVVHAHREPMALAIMKTDPMAAKMAKVIF
jgi:hypothetical protein